MMVYFYTKQIEYDLIYKFQKILTTIPMQYQTSRKKWNECISSFQGQRLVSRNEGFHQLWKKKTFH